MKRLVVVGAGPMGLEGALSALERGFDVTVLEKDRVGESLRRWGHATRFFSPFAMNASPRMRSLLGTLLGAGVPSDDALLTGPEMVERVLLPVARSPLLAGRVREGHVVVAVGRARMSRRDLPGHPLRAERPFRLLVETGRGEQALEADVVLDASGVYQPVALGAGGVPAPGERQLDGRAVRHLGTLEARLGDLSGREVLLVGHGHSAATAVAWLADLPGPPRITWATRSPNRRPCVEFAHDPLPERDRITRLANDLAAEPPSFLTVERRANVEGFEPAPDGRVQVTLSGGRGGMFDTIVGLTGYRPDLSIVSELAIEVSPVSEGAGRLARALSNVTDCLSLPKLDDRDLESGEPGFALVGAKSYGRLPTFLLQNGLAQIEAILGRMASAP